MPTTLRFAHARPAVPAALFVVALTSFACNEDSGATEPEPDVTIERNPDVDLASYASFAVIHPEVRIESDPPPEYATIAPELEQAIIAELTGKGLTHDPDGAELLVNPLVSVTEASDSSSYYQSYWGWYYGYTTGWTVVWDYAEGSLMLDVVDPGDRDDPTDDLLVYRGVANGYLGRDSDIVQLQLRNAVHALFADWPEG